MDAEVAVCAARDCDNEFTPEKRHPNQRYCSSTCRWREWGRERRSDPEYRERVLERKRAWCRERYHSDPEYRERVLERQHERLRSDPEYRERNRERSSERYWNLSGFEYNKMLLKARSRKGLKRMEERHRRLEVERLG